jgi:hypothetical protein
MPWSSAVPGARSGGESPARTSLEHACGRARRPRRGGSRSPHDRAALAPVIPSSAVPAGRQRARSAAGRALPLARPIPAPSLPEDVVYGIGRIDASGRIADRTVISALGWRGGDRLTLTADAGVVIARRDPGGMITLPARAYIAIPAELRRRCGLQPGDRMLLAADPFGDTLNAHSLAVVDQAIRAHGAAPHAQGGKP